MRRTYGRNVAAMTEEGETTPIWEASISLIKYNLLQQMQSSLWEAFTVDLKNWSEEFLFENPSNKLLFSM